MNVHLLFLFPISLFKGLMVAILYCFLNQEVSSSQRDVSFPLNHYNTAQVRWSAKVCNPWLKWYQFSLYRWLLAVMKNEGELFCQEDLPIQNTDLRSDSEMDPAQRI